MRRPLRLSLALLANYVPKCQMSSGPYEPIFLLLLNQCPFFIPLVSSVSDYSAHGFQSQGGFIITSTLFSFPCNDPQSSLVSATRHRTWDLHLRGENDSTMPARCDQNMLFNKYPIPSKYSTSSNYSTPLYLAPRNILSHAQILHFPHLKQHILINETLNMYLNNIKICFNTILALFSYKIHMKIWHFKISKYSTPSKIGLSTRCYN